MKFSRYNLQLNFAEIKLPRAPSRNDSHVRFPLSAIILTVNGNGDGEIRTLDPLLARQVLSQLSYAPILMGLSGLEPPTSRLSGVRSNRLSYKPINLASTYLPIPLPV